MSISIFKYFQTDVSSISLPERFTFPFYYDPHPLALVAAKELQDYLSVQTDFTHDFGIDGVGVGKMFGVLIVRNAENELGYIQAFSGMMSSQTVVNGFAPPLYDILDPEGYFQKKTRVLALLTEAIQSLQIDPSRQSMKTQYELIESNYYQKFKEQKAKHKSDKRARKLIREEKQNNIPEEEYKFLLTHHKQESLNAQFLLKSYGEYIDQELALAKVKYLTSSIKLDALKQK